MFFFSLSSGGDTIQRKWRCCVVPLWLHSCFRISINFIFTIHFVFLTSWSERKRKNRQKKTFNIVCTKMCSFFDFVDMELRSERLQLFEFVASRKMSCKFISGVIDCALNKTSMIHKQYATRMWINLSKNTKLYESAISHFSHLDFLAAIPDPLNIFSCFSKCWGKKLNLN